MKLALSALIGGAGLLARRADSHPPPPPPPPAAAITAPVAAAPGCFYTRDITSHTVGDDRTLYIRLRNNDVYRLGMSGACLAGARSSDPIIMREPPGTTYACRPIDLDISVTLGGLPSGIPSPCIVDSLARLTPAQAAALPPRLRP
jgi:hypothetical protein